MRLRLNDGEPLTHFKAQVEDWWRSEDGRQSFYAPAGTLRSSCGRWVSVNPVESAVGGGDTLTVRVTVSVPATMTVGGYWCALTIDERPDPLAIGPDGVGVRFLTSLSTGIYVSVGESRKDAEISGVTIAADQINVAIRNTGNTPVPVEGRVEFVRPGDDTVVATAVLPRGVLLLDPIPVLRLSAELPAPEKLPPGRYLVRVVVDLGLDYYIGAQQEQDVARVVVQQPTP